MKLTLIRAMTRSAACELENGMCFRPAEPFTVLLDGAVALRQALDGRPELGGVPGALVLLALRHLDAQRVERLRVPAPPRAREVPTAVERGA